MGAILFDMDGTLVNSESAGAKAMFLSYHTLCKAEKLTQPDSQKTEQDMYNLCLGRSVIDNAKELKKHHPETSLSEGEWVARLLKGYHANASVLRAAEPRFKIEDSIQLLIKLHTEGHTIAIVSGSSREDIADIMRLIKIENYIDRFWGAENYDHGKPSPAPYLKAKKYYMDKGMPEDAFFIIEDSTAGAQSAFQANIPFIIRADDPMPFTNFEPKAILETLDYDTIAPLLPKVTEKAKFDRDCCIPTPGCIQM